MSQKGLVPILIVLLIASGIGGYLIYSGKINLNKESNDKYIQLADRTFKDSYLNTTLGFSLNLPYGWVACENSFVPERIKVAQGQTCEDKWNGKKWNASFILTTPGFDLTNPPERLQTESFLDWTKRYSKEATSYIKLPNTIASEFIIITPQIILEKRTTYSPDAVQEPKELHLQIIYIEDIEDKDPQKVAFILTGNDTSPKEFANYLTSLPITTGDIVGITKHNFSGSFYDESKKNIVATFITNSHGEYFVRLKPGTYYFIYSDGRTEKLNVFLGLSTRFNPVLETQ